MREKILVVEDDPAVRHMLTRVLSGEGYLVVPAADTAAAARLAAHEPLDLMVLGIELESADAGGIGQRELEIASGGVPMVLAGTGQTQVTAAHAARIEKPWDVKVLLDAIRTLLAVSRRVTASA